MILGKTAKVNKNFHSVTVPVTSETPGAGKFWSVVRSDGTEVTIQVVPVPEAILRAPGRDSKANFNLYFIGKSIVLNQILIHKSIPV